MLIITKSDFTATNICAKQGWYQKHHIEFQDKDDTHTLELGNEVGDLAMRMFGSFVEIPFGRIRDMCSDTERALTKNKVICEASFLYEDLFCSVDILKIKDAKKKVVEIYEVKSTTGIKDYHKLDIAFQANILQKLGYTVSKAALVFINKDYEYRRKLSVKKLFHIEDVTSYVEEKIAGELSSLIDNVRNILSSSTEPSCSVGVQCHYPFDCSFFKHCAPPPTETDISVFELGGMTFKKKTELWNAGIDTYTKVLSLVNKNDQIKAEKAKAKEKEKETKPKEKEKEDKDTPSIHAPKESIIEVTDRVRLQVEAALGRKQDVFDCDKVEDFLSQFEFPLYFLDYETIMDPIPKYKGVHPYDQIPFQFSLHILYEDGTLKHKEFLGKEGADPRLNSIKALIRYCGTTGSVIAYNASFEKTVIANLAKQFPKYESALMSIHNRFVDLMVPFKNNWYYKKEFCGSYSIKKVLPALFPGDPELDYHNLEMVQNGTEAMNTYRSLPKMTRPERNYARFRLLRYCELDTYAMVKTYVHLKEKVSKCRVTSTE